MKKKEPKIVISLTSYPGRIRTVYRTIESLFAQKEMANEIILWLSIMEFPNKYDDLPENLRNLVEQNGFHIEWVRDNLKSHKKYFYILQNSDNIVITVDDDVVYSDTMLSELLESYRKYPCAVSARRTRLIIKEGEKLSQYKNWDDYLDEYVGVPRKDLCAIGVGGVLYPPQCATDRWFAWKTIKCVSEKQDDLWLKFNEIIDGYPVVYVKPIKQDITIEKTEKTALSVSNIEGGENDISLAKLSVWMKNGYMDIYNAWLAEIMQSVDYISNKKEYYAIIFKNILSEANGIPVYLYGAGKKARRILKILSDFELIDRLEAVLVSNKAENPDVLEAIPVRSIKEIDKFLEFGVIYGISNIYKDEVDTILKSCHCKYLDLDFQGLLRYYEV